MDQTAGLTTLTIFPPDGSWQDNSLLFVGGASMEDGKVEAVDHVLLPQAE
ncbi:MAG: hypothetical protein R3C11_11590 [Planctomycetaceae bacterium]